MGHTTISTAYTDASLNRYFKEAWKFPLLDKKEEFDLAHAWKHSGDVDAAHKLVTSHLRLVAKIAMSFRGYGLPMADLVSEGNIGLMKAVKKFNPEFGFRLSTYAMWWIKAAITEYVLRSWSLVKIGTVASQKKLFFKLRKMKSLLKIDGNNELTPEQIEKISLFTKTSHGDIIQMNRRLAGRDLSINAPLSGSEDNVDFQDTLIDQSPSPECILAERQEMAFRGSILRNIIKTLPEREREIFVERKMTDNPKTLSELGEQYNVSRERIRQLEARALEKVQKEIKNTITPIK